MDTGTFLLTVPQQYIGSFAEAVGAQPTNEGVSAGDVLEVRVEQGGGLASEPEAVGLTRSHKTCVASTEHRTAGVSGKDEATWHCQGLKCMLPPRTGASLLSQWVLFQP